MALAAERLAAEAVVGGTGVPTRILRLQILETQQTVVGDQDDVITFTPRSEGPEEVVDVIVYEGTGITFGIAGQYGEGPHVMVCSVRVHLYHGGADLVVNMERFGVLVRSVVVAVGGDQGVTDGAPEHGPIVVPGDG